MTQTFSGDTGASAVADGAVTNTKLAAGAVTPDKLSGGQSGSAPVYGCRAWGCLNGTSATILAAANIASIVRNGTGNYTVTFTVPMQDANYCAVTNSGSWISEVTSQTASSFVVAVFNGSGTAVDTALLNVAVFR
jgi:hypothetical protein